MTIMNITYYSCYCDITVYIYITLYYDSHRDLRGAADHFPTWEGVTQNRNLRSGFRSFFPRTITWKR